MLSKNYTSLEGLSGLGKSAEVGFEEYPEDEWEDQDRIEALAVYNILENDLIPRFYNRGRDGLAREWIGMAKNGVKEMAAFFSTDRMVQEYTELFYMLNYERVQDMHKNNLQNGREYANWRQHIEQVWKSVKILNVGVENKTVNVGSKSEIVAPVQLGSLQPDDVKVQLYVGHFDTRGEIIQGEAQDMSVVEGLSAGRARSAGASAAGGLSMSVAQLPFDLQLLNALAALLLLLSFAISCRSGASSRW